MPLRLLSYLLLAMLLAGCATARYYGQAVGGALEVLNRSRYLDDVINDDATPPETVRRLKLARDIRHFASDSLGLPDNRSYLKYTDLGRRYLIWNVVATPELSLSPRLECFLVVGCLSYRGFFDEQDARAYALQRTTAGDDVFVYGIPAYSTLGWFYDPLVSTFLGYGELDLARLVFHELAHQLLYVKDDTAFNEAFATAVELEGARRWLAFRASPEHAAIEQAEQRRHEFQALLRQTRERLLALYASPAGEAEKRQGKRQAFMALGEQYQAFKARWHGYGGYDHWFDPPPGNAHLTALATYHELVPAFTQLLREHGGDLPAFYRAAAALAARDRTERDAELQALTRRARD